MHKENDEPESDKDQDNESETDNENEDVHGDEVENVIEDEESDIDENENEDSENRYLFFIMFNGRKSLFLSNSRNGVWASLKYFAMQCYIKTYPPII